MPSLNPKLVSPLSCFVREAHGFYRTWQQQKAPRSGERMSCYKANGISFLSKSDIFFFFLSFLDKPEHQYVCLRHVPIPMNFPSKPDSFFIVPFTCHFNRLLALLSLSWKYPLNGGSQGCFGQMSILQLHHAKNKPEIYTVFTWGRSVPTEKWRQFIQQ